MGLLSIFFIERVNGFENISIKPYPTRLEVKDFAQAIFLFSLSVFGVIKIDSGRTVVDNVKIVAAENNAPLSAANIKHFFISLLL